MVEQIKELLRDGRHLAEAVEEGAVRRLRPVLMTGLGSLTLYEGPKDTLCKEQALSCGMNCLSK